jgi:hypothetical protein
VTITPTANFAAAGDHKILYLNVGVQNIGNVVIRGRSCCLTVWALSGTEERLMTPQPLCRQLDPVDRAHLFTIDKGEWSTFGFAIGLPEIAGKPVTATHIFAKYESQQITDEGQPLTWIYDAIVPVEGSATPRPAKPHGTQPAAD